MSDVLESIDPSSRFEFEVRKITNCYFQNISFFWAGLLYAGGIRECEVELIRTSVESRKANRDN